MSLRGFLTMPILGCCLPPMAAIATNSNISNSSSQFTPTNRLKHRCFKHSSFPHTFSASTSRIVQRKAVSGRNGFRVPKTIENLMKGSVSRERNSDEGFQGLEQEAFIGGSSELIRSKFVLRGVESIINRLSKWIISAIFSGLILWRHDAEALWFAAGSALNVMLSVELKYILNQERPSTLQSDPGMPSSHAQTVFFIAMFAILSSVKGVGMNEFTITISGLALAFGFYFSYLRVSQQLHTVSQVVVGAAIGTLFCFSWYWLWNAFVVNAIGSSMPVKLIVVSGSTGIWLGYTVYSVLEWLKKE